MFTPLNAQFDKIPIYKSVDDRLDVTRTAAEIIAEPISALAHMPIRQIINRWSEGNWAQRQKTWPHLMMWVMYHRPRDALDVLQASCRDLFPPMALVADALDYVTSSNLGDPRKVDITIVDRLFDVTYRLLTKSPERPLLHQRTLRLLFKSVGRENSSKLYDALRKRSIRMHGNTMLHICESLARNHDFTRAKDVLFWALASGVPVNATNFLKCCTRLLSELGRTMDGHRESVALFAELLNRGLRPNSYTYNVTIQNAMEAGDHQVGWQMFRAMRDDGTPPDRFTFSIMLNGAKQKRDWGMIDRLMVEFREVHVEPDEHIISDLLQIIHLYMNTQSGQAAFASMLRRFEDYYSDAILRQLELLRAGGGEEAGGPETLALRKPDPPPVVVSVMLSAYLARCHDWQVLARLYTRYRTEVAGQAALRQDAVTTNYIVNSFLQAFARARHTLWYGDAILEDMMNGTRTGLAPPTAHSFQILMTGYVRYRHLGQAERILDMMIDYGVAPDQATWNVLLAGYAQRQDVDGAVDVVRRMERQGLLGDEYTTAALAKIQNREVLGLALEALRKEQADEATLRMEKEDAEVNNDDDDDEERTEGKERTRLDVDTTPPPPPLPPRPPHQSPDLHLQEPTTNDEEEEGEEEAGHHHQE